MPDQIANNVSWLLTGVTISFAAVAIYNCARVVRVSRRSKARNRRAWGEDV